MKNQSRLMILCCLVCALAWCFGSSASADIAPRIDMSRVIVESDSGCSGVIVHDQLVVTAKHCGRTSSFRSGRQRSSARLVWVSDMPDGPMFYRVRRGFGSSSISILPSPPKPNSSVDLFWNGQTTGVNGRVAGLQTVEVTDHGSRSKYKIESNLIMANSVPGASGGAAVQKNQLAGIILHGSAELGETGICINEDLRRGYMIAMQEMQKLPTCTVFTISNCGSCNQMKRDYDGGSFIRIPCEFEFLNCDKANPPGVTEYPTYEIFGVRLTQPKGYNGQELASWICQQVRIKEESTRNDALLEPVPDYVPPDVQVSPSLPSQQSLVPSGDVTEDEWKGVRIVGLANNKYSSVSAMLAGPITRMVETMSNGKAKFETIFQASEPVKYRGIATRAGISDMDIPIYIFVLVDTIAEVNFVKGMILKKIEANIDKALSDKLREIPVEPVIRRIHPELYNSILATMQMTEPGSIATDKTTNTKVADSDPDKVETSNATHGVAGGFAFLSVSTLFRVWRFWQGWHHSGTVGQTLDLSIPTPPPTRATVTVQAPAPAAPMQAAAQASHPQPAHPPVPHPAPPAHPQPTA